MINIKKKEIMNIDLHFQHLMRKSCSTRHNMRYLTSATELAQILNCKTLKQAI